MFLSGLLVLFSVSLYAQNDVSGVVKSPTGEILPGVTVLVKGTTTGVITDFDGKYSYSQIVAVNFSGKGFLANIYPNPFNDYLYVDMPKDINDDSVITIYDITGKIITEKNIKNEGSHILIQLEKNLPNGVYFLKIYNNSTVNFYKIIKRAE